MAQENNSNKETPVTSTLATSTTVRRSRPAATRPAATRYVDPVPVVPSKPTLNQLRERDNELVKGKFTFEEVPGGTLTFPYRKYKGDKIITYSLKDGEIYSIPKGVAKHLATTGKYPIHEYTTDEKGNPFVRVGRVKKRYNFESLEFFDDSDLEPSRLYLR